MSRYLLIALAFAAGVYRVVEGGWVTSIGLFALGAGLLLLRLSTKRSATRVLAYACLLTAAATAVILFHYRRDLPGW